MKIQENSSRVRLADGIWTYYCATRKREYEISSLLRQHGYQRDKIVKALGLCDRTFHRIILDSLDVTPGYWLRRERAVYARKRLLNGASVKELAIELGFEHAGDFSKEFKLWHDVPPMNFIIARQTQESERRRVEAMLTGEG